MSNITPKQLRDRAERYASGLDYVPHDPPWRILRAAAKRIEELECEVQIASRNEQARILTLIHVLTTHHWDIESQHLIAAIKISRDKE